jgi:transposase
MCRLRGRSPRGERLQGQAPFGEWSTHTFIAGLKCDGLTSPFLDDGPMDGEAFDVYIATQLSPLLRKRNVVSLDNLNVHKNSRATASLAARVAWFLFLLEYSPELNPIEMAFSKLKAHLRKAAERTIDALWRAVRDICSLLTSEECRNFFSALAYVAD